MGRNPKNSAAVYVRFTALSGVTRCPSRTNDNRAGRSASGVIAVAQIRQRWRLLRRGRPGHRFQEWYARARVARHRPGALARIARLLLALVCLAVGLFLVVFPGPAIPFLMIAGGLLALESRPIARLMDWVELRLRAIWRWGWKRWCRLPSWLHVALLVMGACVSAASMYIAYRIFVA